MPWGLLVWKTPSIPTSRSSPVSFVVEGVPTSGCGSALRQSYWLVVNLSPSRAFGLMDLPAFIPFPSLARRDNAQAGDEASRYVRSPSMVACGLSLFL